MVVRTLLRSSWLAATLIACAAVGILVFSLRHTAIGLGPSASAGKSAYRPMVLLSKATAQTGVGAWDLHSMMNDLSPLFLPSDRNARLPALPLREPGDGTLDAETAILRFREADSAILLSLPPGITLNDKPLSQATELDGLRADYAASFASGLGRRQLPVVPAPARGGLIEVYASGSGQIIHIEELKEGLHPLWPQVWQPLEFLAAVDPSGLVSPLSLTVASRVDSVDAFFRDYLARTFRVGERLAPGFYRIVVSP
jgi:hypothetical protein